MAIGCRHSHGVGRGPERRTRLGDLRPRPHDHPDRADRGDAADLPCHPRRHLGHVVAAAGAAGPPTYAGVHGDPPRHHHECGRSERRGDDRAPARPRVRIGAVRRSQRRDLHHQRHRNRRLPRRRQPLRARAGSGAGRVPSRFHDPLRPTRHFGAARGEGILGGGPDGLGQPHCGTHQRRAPLGQPRHHRRDRGRVQLCHDAVRRSGRQHVGARVQRLRNHRRRHSHDPHECRRRAHRARRPAGEHHPHRHGHGTALLRRGGLFGRGVGDRRQRAERLRSGLREHPVLAAGEQQLHDARRRFSPPRSIPGVP